MPKIPEEINIHYDGQPLLPNQELPQNPYALFDQWMQLAIQKDIRNANAMALATCGKDGFPSNRMVLLKEYNKNQFVFYTNYGSAKARDLKENPCASLLFFWDALQRQIRIQGVVCKGLQKISADYFASRSRGSRIGAYVSEFQSQPIAARKVLEDRETNLIERFSGQEIPLPNFWGGYVLTAHSFEFWKGREHRLHDRICFIKKEKTDQQHQDGDWLCQRLVP